MHSLWIQKTEKTHSCFHIPNADSDIFSGQHLLYVMVTSKHVCLVPPDPHLLSDWDCAWEGNTSPLHGLINNTLIYVVKRGFLWLPDAVWWGMWCEYMVTSLYKTSKSRCVCIVLFREYYRSKKKHSCTAVCYFSTMDSTMDLSIHSTVRLLIFHGQGNRF